ncbi:MAG TPA: hypothetical protein PKO22_02440 [Treponemataceae bacterium]|nr:hypothetical protein [Treponemataceae bacterium]
MKRTLTMIVILLVALCGCSKGKAADGQAVSDEAPTQKSSGWYYFSDSGIHPAENPASIPPRKFVPWTEAVRVSDAAVVNDVPAFLINRLGLMTGADADKASEMHTAQFFSQSTAAGILRVGDSTAVRMYRNSFFSEASPTDSGPNAFLAAYEPESGRFNALLSSADLGLEADAQCVSLDRFGSMWYASFKTVKGNKVDFDYLEFPEIPAKDKSSGAVDLSGVKKLSSESFQKSVTPFGLSDVPETLKPMIAKLPESLACTIRVYTDSTLSTQTYARRGEGDALEAVAYASKDRSAMLFSDGTFYYRGNNSSDSIKTIQLPSLSRGYVYTSFILTGNTLLAAWEEQRFFETGRSGILETPLPDGV